MNNNQNDNPNQESEGIIKENANQVYNKHKQFPNQPTQNQQVGKSEMHAVRIQILHLIRTMNEMKNYKN